MLVMYFIQTTETAVAKWPYILYRNINLIAISMVLNYIHCCYVAASAYICASFRIILSICNFAHDTATLELPCHLRHVNINCDIHTSINAYLNLTHLILIISDFN